MYHYIVTSIRRQKNRSILVILVNCVLRKSDMEKQGYICGGKKDTAQAVE